MLLPAGVSATWRAVLRGKKVYRNCRTAWFGKSFLTIGLIEESMVCRFALQNIEILSEINSEEDRNQSGMPAKPIRCKRFNACQSVKKSGHDCALIAHDDRFKTSRMVISSPDPLRGTLKRRLNSPLVRFCQ